jgi:hypothetical protein
MKFIILLLISVATVSADYIPFGCYTGAGVNWISQNNVYKTNLDGCKIKCKSAEFPLMAFKNNQCYCGVDILPPNTKSVCNGNMQLFYDALNWKKCNHVDAKINKFTFVYGWENIRYYSDNSIDIKLQRFVGSAMYENIYSQYGLYCMRIKASNIPGAISAFYLSNDPQNIHKTQDEIDFEFINSPPCKSRGCIWTNNFVNGRQYNATNFEQTELQKLVGNPKFSIASSYHNYCIDWNRYYIRWFVDGKLIRKKTSNIPQKKMTTFISLWTNKNPKKWGGSLPSSAPPTYTAFADYRKIICI